MHNMRFFHSRQPLVEPTKLEGKSVVIYSQAMQNRGVEIANVDWIFRNIVTEVIRLAVIETLLDAAPSHPNRKAAAMMIATRLGTPDFSLTVDGTTEFASPNDKRVFQEATVA